MPTILYPDVPNYPGVPALVRGINIPPVITIALGSITTALASAVQTPSVWGIYDSNGNVLGVLGSGNSLSQAILSAMTGPTLSFDSLEFEKGTRIATFPVEPGSFASYNKVELSANPTVTLALDGSESDRTAFLNLINAACLSTDLYSIVTPEIVYYNYSLERYSYGRKSYRGATLLIVEISLMEIREVSASFSTVKTPINNPQNPDAESQVSGGIVQPEQSSLKSLTTKFLGAN